jgi:hypothetical protein
MHNIFKNRIIATALVGVFGVFNIGIPIIVATCSMPEMMRGSTCPMCEDQEAPSTARLATHNATACCTTTIIAERNTNEFMQASDGIHGSALQVLLLPGSFALTGSMSSVSNLSQISPSPPTVVDIPISTSSLLI